jgi:hypothetical protein
MSSKHNKDFSGTILNDYNRLLSAGDRWSGYTHDVSTPAALRAIRKVK